MARNPALELVDRVPPSAQCDGSRPTGVGLDPPARGLASSEPALSTVLERYARHKDPADLDRLVEEYAPLVTRMACRFYRHREPLEDLQQVAYEALLRALQRFDPELGRPFEAFATASIAGTLKRHYRDRGWSMRVPRIVHESYPRLRQIADTLTHKNGQSPTLSELANAADLSIETVIEVLSAHSSREVAPLDPPALESGGDRTSRNTLDAGFAAVDDRESLHLVLGKLSSRERELIQLYYFDGLTQVAIADRLGCGQVQVSRLLRRALLRMRALLALPMAPHPAQSHAQATGPTASRSRRQAWNHAPPRTEGPCQTRGD